MSTSSSFAAVKPEPFVFNENAAVVWPEWKQEFKLFLRASGLKDRKNQYKVSVFLNVIGKEGRRLFNSFGLDEDADALETIFEKFDEHCSPFNNVVMERFKFLSIGQHESQPFDDFLTELRLAIRHCEYDQQENSILRDQIIMKIADSNLRTRLLREPNIKLDKVISACRAFESSNRHAGLIDNKKRSDNVECVDSTGARGSDKRVPDKTFLCSKCGYRHAVRACPAFKKSCAKCHELHHFAKCCPKTNAHNVDVGGETCDPHNVISDPPAEVSTLYCADLDFHDVHIVGAVSHLPDIDALRVSSEGAWFEPLTVGSHKLVCKLDCGATVNVLPLHDYKRVGGKLAGLAKSNIVLMSYGNTTFRTAALGTAELSCRLRDGTSATISFVVADVKAVPLLGFATLQRFGLIKRTIPAHVDYVAGRSNFLSTPEESVKFVHSVVPKLSISVKWLDMIRKSTLSDVSLKLLIDYIATGWPRKLPDQVRPYASIGHLISNDEGILMFHDKIIVPDALRAAIIKEIHCIGHLGLDKCKEKARQSFYWPRLASDFEAYIKSCEPCLKYSRSNQRMPLKSYPVSDRPWQRVGSDILTFAGRDYLVIYDSYSKWLELDLITEKTANKLVDIFIDKFSRYGIIEECVCDNVPYNSRVFLGFAEEYGFTVTNSSPRYPRSNGLAEKAVSIAKNILRKNSDVRMALMQYRNTPIMSLGYSPAQLFYGRRLRDRLPISASLLDFDVPPKKEVKAKLLMAAEHSAKFYDRGTANLCPLKCGDKVMVEQHQGLWEPATIVEASAFPRSYILRTLRGEKLRRNRQHIRLVPGEQSESQASLSEDSQPEPGSTMNRSGTETSRPGATILDEGNGNSNHQVKTSGRARRPPSWMNDFV